jgi:hypothetical protein
LAAVWPSSGDRTYFRRKAEMKLAGFLLLIAGWVIVVTAIGLLHTQGARVGFLLAGLAVQILGLVVVVRSHFILNVERG